jgi:hemoglobin
VILAMLLASASIATGAPTAANATASAADRLAQMEAMCKERMIRPSELAAARSLFERLGGEARIHVVTREMVRLHHMNPTVAGIVRKYDADYLAGILARYLVTATGGPPRYEGPPLSATHAHLHLTNAHFLAGGEDFSQAMRNVGMAESEIVDTLCLLGELRSQIVHE